MPHPLHLALQHFDSSEWDLSEFEGQHAQGLLSKDPYGGLIMATFPDGTSHPLVMSPDLASLTLPQSLVYLSQHLDLSWAHTITHSIIRTLVMAGLQEETAVMWDHTSVHVSHYGPQFRTYRALEAKALLGADLFDEILAFGDRFIPQEPKSFMLERRQQHFFSLPASLHACLEHHLL